MALIKFFGLKIIFLADLCFVLPNPSKIRIPDSEIYVGYVGTRT